MSKPAELPWTSRRATPRALEPADAAVRLACPSVWAWVVLVEVGVVAEEAVVDGVVDAAPLEGVPESSPLPLVRAMTSTGMTPGSQASRRATQRRERRGSPSAVSPGAPSGVAGPAATGAG